MSEMITKEGLVIKIYYGDIRNLPVEGIVNAANESLSHGGGVARAISDAAGYEFDKESKEYVKKHGRLAVGSCCVTSAGKLPYKNVIHTVGPTWYDYDAKEKKLCLNDVQEAVEVTFRRADKLGLRSIAIPAISSGKLCDDEIYMNLLNFSYHKMASSGLWEQGNFCFYGFIFKFHTVVVNTFYRYLRCSKRKLY